MKISWKAVRISGKSTEKWNGVDGGWFFCSAGNGIELVQMSKSNKKGVTAFTVTPWYYWSGREDSNFRPPEPHSGALPDCATSRLYSTTTTKLILF